MTAGSRSPPLRLRRPLGRGLLWCLLAGGAVFWPGPGSESGTGRSLAMELFGQEPTRLRFAQREIDFGTVFSGETVVREFEFRNEASQPVRILEAASTCGCVQATPSARWIEPGASGRIRVEAFLDGRYGPQDLRVRLRTDESAHSGVILVLRGRVRAVLLPRPRRVLIGALAPGERREARVELDVLEPIDDLEAEVRGRRLRARLAPRGEGAPLLLIDVEASHEVGARFEGVLLTCRHRETGRRVETWIPVGWSVPPALVVEPGELRLVGGSGALLVRPRWSGRVRLAGIETGDLPLRIVRHPGDAESVRVEFELTGDAWQIPFGAKLVLQTDPPSFGVVEIPVLVDEEDVDGEEDN